MNQEDSTPSSDSLEPDVRLSRTEVRELTQLKELREIEAKFFTRLKHRAKPWVFAVSLALLIGGLLGYSNTRTFVESLVQKTVESKVDKLAEERFEDMEERIQQLAVRIDRTWEAGIEAGLIARRVGEDADITLAKARESVDSTRARTQRIQAESQQLSGEMAALAERVNAQEEELARIEKMQDGLLERIRTERFSVGDSGRIATLSSPREGGPTIVAMRLEAVPISGSVKIQFHLYNQPPTSFQLASNVVLFRWDPSVDQLKSHALFVSYFADNTTEPKFSAVSSNEDGIFGDKQLLWKWN